MDVRNSIVLFQRFKYAFRRILRTKASLNLVHVEYNYIIYIPSLLQNNLYMFSVWNWQWLEPNSNSTQSSNLKSLFSSRRTAEVHLRSTCRDWFSVNHLKFLVWGWNLGYTNNKNITEFPLIGYSEDWNTLCSRPLRATSATTCMRVARLNQNDSETTSTSCCSSNNN